MGVEDICIVSKKDKEQGGGYIRQNINVDKKQAGDRGLNPVEPQT